MNKLFNTPITLPTGFANVFHTDLRAKNIEIYNSNCEKVGTLNCPLDFNVSYTGFRNGKYFVFGHGANGVQLGANNAHDRFVLFEQPNIGDIICPFEDGSFICQKVDDIVHIDKCGRMHVLDIKCMFDAVAAQWPSDFWLIQDEDGSTLLMKGSGLLAEMDLPIITRLWESGGYFFGSDEPDTLLVINPDLGCVAGRIAYPEKCIVITEVHCSADDILITGVFHNPNLIFIASAKITSSKFELIGKCPLRSWSCISGDGKSVIIDDGNYFNVRSRTWGKWQH